jgi:hypothetical protein
MEVSISLHVQLALTGLASIAFAFFIKAATKIWVNNSLVFGDAYAFSFLVLGSCVLIRYTCIKLLGSEEGITLETSLAPTVAYFILSSLILGKWIKLPESGSVGFNKGFAISFVTIFITALVLFTVKLLWAPVILKIYPVLVIAGSALITHFLYVFIAVVCILVLIMSYHGVENPLLIVFALAMFLVVTGWFFDGWPWVNLLIWIGQTASGVR